LVDAKVEHDLIGPFDLKGYIIYRKRDGASYNLGEFKDTWLSLLKGTHGRDMGTDYL
jgi:hypothetical protein